MSGDQAGVALPDSIGRYRVERVVGAGGFATVYQARDDRLDAAVAVKILAENHCFDPDVRERFLREGRALRRVGSPHVVTVHDLGETPRGQPYLVLAYADRGTLAERVQARRAAGWRPDADDLRYLAGTLHRSLGAVHAAAIVHRDLAPRNLLLTSGAVDARAPCGLVGVDEHLLLADLGLSKDLAVASGLTVAGGTAGFTPPEQRDGPGQVDARADIWAASALLVWLVLDRAPDDAGAWRQGLAEHGWPSALVEALAQGLAPRPDDRFPSVSAWHDGLLAALQPPAPASDEPATSRPPTPTPARARHRRLMLAVALAGALVLGVVASRALWPAEGGDDPDQTVEDAGDDRVRVEAVSGDRRVALVGPDELTVGQTATFEAETSGVEHWIWYGPDGAIHPDAEQIEVTGGSPGRATVRLQAVDGQNQVVEAVLDLTVAEAG